MIRFENCEIKIARDPDDENLTLILLKVRDGKFYRFSSFKLTDAERTKFATELLGMT